MSAYPSVRPPPAALQSGPTAGPSTAAAVSSQQQQQQHDTASSSRNPQLGPRPYFRYPTPTSEEIEEDLPPYWETENIPLGPMLDRLARKGNADLRTLVEKTLPPLATRNKPKHIIEYAKTTRQAALKYLAVLRWKTSVDLVSYSSPAGNTTTTGPQASFPTPHSNGESNYTSPIAHPSKGKARAGESGVDEPVIRGKVTDARRIQQFLEHQNSQHQLSIDHIRHVTGLVETLRERNADLITALTLRASGTYTRLPTNLSDDFIPQTPLKAPDMLDTLERLNEQLLYRLRCVDFLPPELEVERVADGRVHVRGGGPNGWLAELTVAEFQDDSRWWLTGVDWAWSAEGGSKSLAQEEKSHILDTVNLTVLPPRPIPEEGEKKVDAPLVRLYNFLQHLSLAYQLQVIGNQASVMSQGRWRGQLMVENVDNAGKELKLRYWIRQRPAQQPAPGGNKRNPPAPSTAARGQPLFGGIVTISLTESQTALNEAEKVLRDVAACGEVPSERTVRLHLAIKWEVGEAGAGGGLKAGDAMDASILKIDPTLLSVRDILTTATRKHAGYLSRATTTPLLGNPKLTLDPLNPPRCEESETDARPFLLIIPLPIKNGSAQFVISVAPMSGLIDIEDSAARDSGQVTENNRTIRAKLATVSVNEQKTRLADDLWRLISAAVMEDVEDNLRQLGLYPTRRVALRTPDVANTDLHPSSTAFVPLPVSQSHYFVCKVTQDGIAYELLKLHRVPMDNNKGLKMAVSDRIPIELGKLVERRAARGTKRGLDDEDEGEKEDKPAAALAMWEGQDGLLPKGRRFQVDSKDLHDMFTYCNALVAQTMVEQQLKDRGIVYTTQYPDESDFTSPRSRSALAGMVPNICVNSSDLFKDGRAHEVAAPQVYLVIQNWWKGAQCGVETIVRLRHQPSVSDVPQTVAPASSSAARAEGITFDQATQTVRFHAPNMARCVHDFLEQWERLNKVFVVAGEVNRLNKMEQYRDIRMLSFDLCTATLQYAHGFQVAITYTPMTDSYEASFFRAGVSTTPGATPAVDSEPSPHHQLAPLLSHYLNEVTSQSNAAKEAHGGAGQQFIRLLRATLPVLLEVESMRTSNASDYPALVVRSITEYRLVWDHETTRYALDVTLTSNGTCFLLSDPARRTNQPQDLTCGTLTRLPKIESAVYKGFQAARAAKVATPGSAATPMYATPLPMSTPAANGIAKGGGGAGSAGVTTVSPPSSPAIKLDSGTALLVSVEVVADVLRAMGGEIEAAIVAPVPVKATPK